MLDTNYPFMVEFTGSPEAGKTTCIKTILQRFSKAGIKVKYIRESAEIVANSHIPKSSFESHLSMRLLTILNLINARYENYDLVLIDRGLLDGIFYTIKFLTDYPDKYSEVFGLINLLDCLKSTLTPNLLIIFKVDPETAIERKGCEGSIVNINFVRNYNKLLDSFKVSLASPNVLIDTTTLSKKEVSDKVFDCIINKMEEIQRA